MQSKSKRGMAVLAVASVLGAASAGAQAQSSVTLYGQVDAWAGVTKTLDASDHAWGVNSGGMSILYWGMKGSEDLSDGLKAIFTLGAFFRPDTGKYGHFDGDTSFARNSFVGLQSSTWGLIKLGRLTPPYFVSTILSSPFIDSYTFSPMVFHVYLGNGLRGPGGISGLVSNSGQNNAIMYSTPDFDGLTANFIYSAGEQAGHNGQNKWGGNFLYFHGNFAATTAFQQVRSDSAPSDLNALMTGFSRQTTAQLGATYDLSVTKIYDQCQYIRDATNLGDAKSNSDRLDMSVPMGSGSIPASYVYTKTSGTADVKRNTWAVGYGYSLSERTDVYAAYMRDKVTSLSSADTFGVGIRAKF